MTEQQIIALVALGVLFLIFASWRFRYVRKSIPRKKQ
jgi:hypothetical protein